MSKNTRGFSLIELMVVLALVAIVLAISIRISSEVLAKSNVVSQAVSIKGMINQAKGFAMMHGVPVLFDYSGNTVRAVADFDMDGTFGDSKRETVIGNWDGADTQPIDFGFAQTHFSYSGTLDHWSGIQTGTQNFVGYQFVISPLGLIKSPLGSNPLASGAIFIENNDNFTAALYLSPMGDMKIAVKEPTETTWSWND